MGFIAKLIFKLHKWSSRRPDCYIWFGEYDHDWEDIADDPDVGIHGHRACAHCEETTEADTDYYGDYGEGEYF